MKLAAIFILLVISIDGFSQPLSKKEFNQKLLSALKDTYNVISVSTGFEKCAWSIYQAKGDVDKGFYTGYEVAQKCLPKYFDQITFSDSGKKLRQSSMRHFKLFFLEDNKAYSNQINVTGYCGCLIKQFNKQNIRLKTLIDPTFAQSKRFKQIALDCVNENQK